MSGLTAPLPSEGEGADLPLADGPDTPEDAEQDAANAVELAILRMEADPRDADKVVLTLGPPEGGMDQAVTLMLHIVVVVEAGLYTGQLLTVGRLAELKAGDQFQAHYARALNFLAVRPRSEAEVRRRLREKAVPPDTIDAICARLYRARYLDDAAFARYWLAERARTRPRGVRMLRGELRNKGVASAVIDEAVADFEAEAAEAAADEAARLAALPPDPAAPPPEDDPLADANRETREALILAERKARSYASLDPPTFRRRLSGFLLRRGYGYDVVSKVLKLVVSRQSSVVSEDDEEDLEEDNGEA